MCQNTNGFDDTSFQIANTGMNTASLANPALHIATGISAGHVKVFTATVKTGIAGSIVKSITIKAQQPTLQGMVRLFIADNDPTGARAQLYREIPIPVVPQAASTPVPAPQYVMFETILIGDLELHPGYTLYATTQNTQNFNIIVEGIDWAYPASTPTLCCNLVQNAATTTIGTPIYNTALDGSGSINTIFTAGTGFGGEGFGSLIRSITVKALQATQEGVVRIFISPDGSTWYLLWEVYIPKTDPTAFEPSFKQVMNVNFNLQSTYYLGATTQNDESYAITVEAEDWAYPT